MEAKQTPLIELLEAVPVDARLVVDDGPHSTSFHPVGRLCHEAAAALRERLAQPEQESVATPSRSFEDVYKVQTERIAQLEHELAALRERLAQEPVATPSTERERADKAEQNYRLMIKNHVPRNIFDWNRRK